MDWSTPEDYGVSYRRQTRPRNMQLRPIGGPQYAHPMELPGIRTSSAGGVPGVHWGPKWNYDERMGEWVRGRR
jgi:hypothetical protein